MNTLIELYDERAIENILAPDMFRPRRIVYLCPGEIAQDRTRQETLAAFFRRRGWEPELIFVETAMERILLLEDAVSAGAGHHADLHGFIQRRGKGEISRAVIVTQCPQ